MAPHLKNKGWIGIALSLYAFIAISIAEGGLGVRFAARFGLNIIPILLLPLAIVMVILHRLLK